MHFTKYTGLGNDFVFLDGAAAQAVKDPCALARKICNRRWGVGADGLILLLPSDKADVRMRIINSDGSEAEMCGNASRCVPLHLRATGQTSKKEITLETLAGPIRTEITDEKSGLVRVNMGVPKLLRGQIPMTGPAEERAQDVPLKLHKETVTGTGVSMGNPHFVIFTDDLSDYRLQTLGPKVETHPAFPQKTNVELVQILSPQALRMRVWERGAGITHACGTGACASAVALFLKGGLLCTREADVHLDGGTLHIAWPDEKEIFMTGPAQKTFEGDFDYDTM